MSSAFSVDFLEPTSDFQTPITFFLVEKTQSGYSFFNWIARKILVIKLLGFAENFQFLYSSSCGFYFG